MAITYVGIIIEEIVNDIKGQTKEEYDAGDLITLQTLLMQDYSKVTDQYYISNIHIDDCIAIKWAIRDLVKKISWSLYHGSYREMKWLEEFDKSYAESL